MSRPGIIRKFFIVRKLDRLTKGELTLQTYLKKNMDELLRLNPVRVNMDRINYLQEECSKTVSKIAELQAEKKKTYFKLI